MTIRTRPAAPRRIVRRLVAGFALALTLAGCQTAGSGEPTYTGSVSTSAVISSSDLNPEQALAAVQKWGSAYGRDPTDKVAAMNYSAALKAAGETQQAVAVMRKAAIYHADDREVLAAFGKALAADGRFQEALATVRRAQRADNPDWQLLATEGGILDSVGQHEDARKLYRQGLVLAPGEPQLLNNLGMSYVLTGELEQAEAVLSEAAASPRATLKTRQNLALVIRLRSEGAQASPLPGPAAMSGTMPEDLGTAAQAPAVQENTWKEIAQSG